MAGYDIHDRDISRQILRGEVVDEWDPRYFDSHGNLRDSNPASSPSQLVPRGRHDTGYAAAEHGQRDFLVATSSSSDDRDLIRRARSSEPGYVHHDYEYHRSYAPRHHEYPHHDRDYEYRVRRSDRYYEDDLRSEARSAHHSKHKHHHHASHPAPSGLSTQEKIIAAVAGAALLAGGKELYDRHEAKEERTQVQRNPLASAALAGFGALAAYEGVKYYGKQQARRDRTASYILHRGRGDSYSEYHSSEDENDEGYSSREKKGHKNFLESALAATGLAAAVKGLAGAAQDGGRRTDDARTRSRSGASPTTSRASSSDDHRDHVHGKSKVQQAAIASLLAGATEAFRVAKEPGSWKGEKTKRVLTAAAGAATVDAAHGADHGKFGMAEAVIGGLIGNRLLNGSRNDIEEDKVTGRSRSRSRSRTRSHARPGGGGGGSGSGAASIAALATAGLGALTAKKASQHHRRSRTRSRSRSEGRRGHGVSTSLSRDRSRRERSRSRSVVDKARDGLAKLGLGGSAPPDDNGHSRRDRGLDAHDRDDSRRSHRRHEHHRRGDARDVPSGYESDSDLGDSEDDRGSLKRDHRRH